MNEAETRGGGDAEPLSKKTVNAITMESITFFYLLAHYWLPRESLSHSTAVKSYTPNKLVFISLEELAVGQKISLCLTTPNVPSENLYPQVMAKVAKVRESDNIFEVEVTFDHELPVEAPVANGRPKRPRIQMDFEEHREWKRHEVNIQAEFQFDPASEVIPCTILDISNGGVKFTSKARLKKNQKIYLVTENMGTKELKKSLAANVLIHWVRQKRHDQFEAGGQFLDVNFKEWRAATD